MQYSQVIRIRICLLFCMCIPVPFCPGFHRIRRIGLCFSHIMNVCVMYRMQSYPCAQCFRIGGKAGSSARFCSTACEQQNWNECGDGSRIDFAFALPEVLFCCICWFRFSHFTNHTQHTHTTHNAHRVCPTTYLSFWMFCRSFAVVV